MPGLNELSWSAEVASADWIRDRLAVGRHIVTSIIPSGFSSYARVLHPARRTHGATVVRWREVASWSHMALGMSSDFHWVALPAEPRTAPPPWEEGPDSGNLWPADLTVLTSRLRRHTLAPDDCWFCLWSGYGWVGVTLVREGSPPVPPSADPIPESVQSGPEVRLPDREYFLYRGSVESAIVWDPDWADRPQTANLWWPEDKSWCVATEIDLPWTYVGGSQELVGELVETPGIEAVEVDAEAPVAEIAPWVATWVTEAVNLLLDRGEATITTPLGSVQAWLDMPGRWRAGALTTSVDSIRGGRGSGSRSGLLPLRTREEQYLRRSIECQLENALFSLTD